MSWRVDHAAILKRKASRCTASHSGCGKKHMSSSPADSPGVGGDVESSGGSFEMTGGAGVEKSVNSKVNVFAIGDRIMNRWDLQATVR